MRKRVHTIILAVFAFVLIFGEHPAHKAINKFYLERPNSANKFANEIKIVIVDVKWNNKKKKTVNSAKPLTFTKINIQSNFGILFEIRNDNTSILRSNYSFQVKF